MAKISPGSKTDLKDFLLTDYKYIGDSLWRNEEIGEKRIKFFITLVTAVITALVTLGTGMPDKDPGAKNAFFFIVVFALLALFFIGIITLFRIIKRNGITDCYKKEMDAIRQRIKDYYDSENILNGYLPFKGGAVPSDKQYQTDKGRETGKKNTVRKLGGLAHTAAAINSLVLAALSGFLVFKNGGLLSLAAAVAVLLVSFVIQYVYIRIKDRESKSALRSSEYTHAGGIVFRTSNTHTEYLLVTAKKNKERWVLPKGHIEPYEGHGETAIREVKEEAGVSARLVEPVGFYSREKGDTTIIVKMYLMEFISGIGHSPEKRLVEWLPFKKALKQLSHEEAKDLLRRADYLVRENSCQEE